MARKLSNWLDTYIQYTAESESPQSFHFWTGVSMIAGALRRKCWLDMGYFQWSPNFFIFLVAPPAIVSKSTSANLGAKLLMKVDGVRFGPASVTWQALLDAMADSAETWPLTRSNDPQAKLMGEQMDMSCLTVVASELGTFFDPQNREMVDLLNDMWDGKDMPFIRRTRLDGPKTIANPWINLLACTTPAWLADNINQQFADGGFASRSIFVFSEVKRQLVAYPFTRLNGIHTGYQGDLTNDLRHIAELWGPYTLTPDAIAWGTKWYSKHYDTQLLSGGQRYRGHLDRKQTHLHKLAMVLSAARRDDQIITPRELEEADRHLTELEPNIPRIFSGMNKELLAEFAGEFVDTLVKNPGMGRKEIFRRFFFRRWSYETYSKVIDSACETDVIALAPGQHDTGFLINPKVLEEVRVRQAQIAQASVAKSSPPDPEE